jgi:hypothetical protein
MGQKNRNIYMQSTENKIVNRIKKCGRGKVYFADDFATCGTPEAIKKALQRLQKSEVLTRAARGIYYYPKKDTDFYGEKYQWQPSLDDIARAIAKRDKARIVPTESYALNLLHLSTQVPVNVVYITDGVARRIIIGKGRGILFKHTAEVKKLAYKSYLLMLIVSALREIGEGNVTTEQKEIIRSHFSHISKKEFETDIKLIPLWIRKLLLSL